MSPLYMFLAVPQPDFRERQDNAVLQCYSFVPLERKTSLCMCCVVRNESPFTAALGLEVSAPFVSIARKESQSSRDQTRMLSGQRNK